MQHGARGREGDALRCELLEGGWANLEEPGRAQEGEEREREWVGQEGRSRFASSAAPSSVHSPAHLLVCPPGLLATNLLQRLHAEDVSDVVEEVGEGVHSGSPGREARREGQQAGLALLVAQAVMSGPDQLPHLRTVHLRSMDTHAKQRMSHPLLKRDARERGHHSFGLGLGHGLAPIAFASGSFSSSSRGRRQETPRPGDEEAEDTATIGPFRGREEDAVQSCSASEKVGRGASGGGVSLVRSATASSLPLCIVRRLRKAHSMGRARPVGHRRQEGYALVALDLRCDGARGVSVGSGSGPKYRQDHLSNLGKAESWTQIGTYNCRWISW